MFKRIIGFFLLLPIWYYVVQHNSIDGSLDTYFYIREVLIILALGLSYSLAQKKNYPVQLVITAIVSAIIVYHVKDGYYLNTISLIFLFTLLSGTFFVLAGDYGVRAFTFILFPFQKFLRSIGIRVSISIIAGVLLIPIGIGGIKLFQLIR